jgi:hypothetical protein
MGWSAGRLRQKGGPVVCHHSLLSPALCRAALSSPPNAATRRRLSGARAPSLPAPKRRGRPSKRSGGRGGGARPGTRGDLGAGTQKKHPAGTPAALPAPAAPATKRNEKKLTPLPPPRPSPNPVPLPLIPTGCPSPAWATSWCRPSARRSCADATSGESNDTKASSPPPGMARLSRAPLVTRLAAAAPSLPRAPAPWGGQGGRNWCAAPVLTGLNRSGLCAGEGWSDGMARKAGAESALSRSGVALSRPTNPPPPPPE